MLTMRKWSEGFSITTTFCCDGIRDLSIVLSPVSLVWALDKLYAHKHVALSLNEEANEVLLPLLRLFNFPNPVFPSTD